jgi:hypothetical protein
MGTLRVIIFWIVLGIPLAIWLAVYGPFFFGHSQITGGFLQAIASASSYVQADFKIFDLAPAAMVGAVVAFAPNMKQAKSIVLVLFLLIFDYVLALHLSVWLSGGSASVKAIYDYQSLDAAAIQNVVDFASHARVLSLTALGPVVALILK